MQARRDGGMSESSLGTDRHDSMGVQQGVRAHAEAEAVPWALNRRHPHLAFRSSGSPSSLVRADCLGLQVLGASPAGKNKKKKSFCVSPTPPGTRMICASAFGQHQAGRPAVQARSVRVVWTLSLRKATALLAVSAQAREPSIAANAVSMRVSVCLCYHLLPHKVH